MPTTAMTPADGTKLQTQIDALAKAMAAATGEISALTTKVSDLAAKIGSPTVPPTVTPRPGSPIGICCTFIQAGDPTIVADMKASGINWVRFDAFWYYTESRKGTYDWAGLDAAVNTVTDAGLTPLVILQTTPQWAQPAGSNLVTYGAVGPTAVAGYAAFCAAVATRYGKKIGAYEIWNEANLDQFWGPTPGVAAYLTAARAGVAAIKQVDSTLVVISQGIGGAGSAPDIGCDPWLSQFYAQGGDHLFDGIGVHSYSNNAGLWEVSRVQAYMTQYARVKPIWLTETSYQSGLTEAQQAQVIAATPAQFAKYAPQGGVICYYTYKEGDWGVIRAADGHAKPARAELIKQGATIGAES